MNNKINVVNLEECGYDLRDDYIRLLMPVQKTDTAIGCKIEKNLFYPCHADL